MITLPKLVVTDTDNSTTGLMAKTDAAGDAPDFSALLSGVVTGNGAKTDKSPLTLADLQEASRQRPQGNTKNTLNHLLAQQESGSQDSDEQSLLHAAQSVLQGLSPQAASDVVKQLNSTLQKENETLTADDDTLAGLSALMAMLPPPLTPTVQAPSLSQPGAGEREIATTLATTTGAPAGETATDTTDLLGHSTHGKPQAFNDINSVNQATSPLVTAAAAKADNDSTLSAATPTMTPAVIPGNATATVNTHPVVTVNSQLGTPEWQQNVSQHITLFTRQGQQTAELRLHPEHLGQVNITLKIDDNQAQLQMVSAHSHVRAALEAALPVLRTQLADNGIQLAQSNISSDSFAGQQQQSSFGQQGSQRSTEGRAFAADEEETLSVPATLQAQVRGSGAVDIFA